jgi:hypothetical protein
MPRPTGKLLERPLGVFVPLASMRMSSASRVNGQFAVALAHFPGSGANSGLLRPGTALTMMLSPVIMVSL